MTFRRLALFALACVMLFVAACSNGPSRSAVVPDLPSASPLPSPSPSSSTRPASGSASAEPDLPFSFVVVGDFGVGGRDEGAIASAARTWAATHPVDAFVTTGDDVYDSGSPDAFDDAWRKPYGWVERAGIPVVASIGNHDVRTGGGAPVMKLLGMPNRWYVRSFSGVQMIVLDGNDPGNPKQLEFMRTQIDPDAKHRIVIFHQPMWSCSRHGTTASINRLWLPILRDGKATLLLNGHDHLYERFATDPPAIVTGGGGAGLYGMGQCPSGTPTPAANRVVRHFLYVVVTDGAVHVQAIDANGSAFDDARY